MKELITVMAVISHFLIVDSRVISKQIIDEEIDSKENQSGIKWDNEEESVEQPDVQSSEEYAAIGQNNNELNEPCAIVIQAHAPNMQSLIRRYRYDANGLLIPNSVKYFIKLLHPPKQSPILVPVRDQAYSPLGGFVRYYKHVPPIPPFW